ncbi:glycosyltransferase family 2 protein [Herbaspirillum sp. meg3]|uniref:glycosyltransferase family 2 protein n=1 Tax=Herbaspirillum sp. meg3 TaxID=2025949 RepID=UPI0018DF21CC|nr:glycosyltransferase family A protein [Herbaspirillum sp. meg3]
MKMPPLFSIVVTTHRRPQILERALNSLLTQTFTDFEIVLATDEGGIETKEAAARNLRESDIFLVLPHTKGPAETRNAGVHHATGRYILFLDDDDSYQSDFLQNIADSNVFVGNAINYTNYTKVRERQHPEGVELLSSTEVNTGTTEIGSLLVSNFIPNNAIVMSSSIAKHHRFDVNLNSHEDWDYLLSLVLQYEFNFLNIAGPVVHNNEGPSRNNTSSGSRTLDYLSIYRKWPIDDPEVKAKRKEMLKSFGLDLPQELL